MKILFELIGYVVYASMAVLALWGAFCAIMVWRRVGQVRFRNEEDQEEFLAELDSQVLKGNYEAALEMCEDDRRALPQLAIYAIEHRDQGAARVQRRLWERFQQDIMADIEHRMSWVSTVAKSAPMIGLFGTVLGMMGAFDNLSSGAKVDPGQMAKDIMFALITTALGLSIAVPLVILTNSINIRLRKMEDLVTLGLTRLAESIKTALSRA
jgi:biopolymer transport protein ExbB/TolQ